MKDFAAVMAIVGITLIPILGPACAAKHQRPPLQADNLPDTLPACSSLYRWKAFPIARGGGFGDRAIFCFLKADGTWAWHEVQYREVE